MTHDGDSKIDFVDILREAIRKAQSLDTKYQKFVALYARHPSAEQFRLFAHIEYSKAEEYISSLSHNTTQSTEENTTFKTEDNLFATGYPATKNPKLEATARILLLGVYDDTNSLSIFRGMRYIIKAIYEFGKDMFIPYIVKTDYTAKYLEHKTKNIQFPIPTNININMMPFVMSYKFTDTKLPNYLKPYHEYLIKVCCNHDITQLGKTCYLTVQESLVDKDKAQRRPGLHVEHPGYIYMDGDKGGGAHEKQWVDSWGGGYYKYYPVDGIYIASSVDDSCVVWDCKIVAHDGREVIGNLGDIEHLRSGLPRDIYRKQMLKANNLYWITDRTPHEALPMKEKKYRQFFRLVTHNVSVWHAQHSTKNPNGVMPDSKITRIITGNKFETNNE